MPRILLIAYGNPLRRDDGIAWRAVDALEGKFSESEVELLRLHQPTPEVADALRDREFVIFVDAACLDNMENSRSGEVHVRELADCEIQKGPSVHFTHVYSPETVLELARVLYRASPKAFVITGVGENFGHGDRMSPAVIAALPDLVATIERVVEEGLSKSRNTKDTK